MWMKQAANQKTYSVIESAGQSSPDVSTQDWSSCSNSTPCSACTSYANAQTPTDTQRFHITWLLASIFTHFLYEKVLPDRTFTWTFSVKSEFWPQWEQLEEWASSCPGHFWAGSCRGSWGKSSAHNPGNTRSLDSAPCDGRWSLWWTWWRDKKGAGIIKNQQHKVSSQ